MLRSNSFFQYSDSLKMHHIVKLHIITLSNKQNQNQTKHFHLQVNLRFCQIGPNFGKIIIGG